MLRTPEWWSRPLLELVQRLAQHRVGEPVGDLDVADRGLHVGDRPAHDRGSIRLADADTTTSPSRSGRDTSRGHGGPGATVGEGQPVSANGFTTASGSSSECACRCTRRSVSAPSWPQTPPGSAPCVGQREWYWSGRSPHRSSTLGKGDGPAEATMTVINAAEWASPNRHGGYQCPALSTAIASRRCCPPLPASPEPSSPNASTPTPARSPATNGKAPSLRVLIRIAETFNVTVDYPLIEGAPRRPLNAPPAPSTPASPTLRTSRTNAPPSPTSLTPSSPSQTPPLY